MNVKDLKKIELHCHLDGSVRESTADSLLGRKSNMTVSPDCKDLNEYLEKFNDPVECMQTKENLKRIAKELTEDLEEDNVIYAEIRFAPMQHINTLKPEEVVESVLEGLKQGNIQTTLILCMMRGADYRTNHKVIELANKYNLPIDLAGAEALYPTKDYEQLFMEAKKLHLNCTIHAGESDGPKSIREALHFGTKRIGHGVSIVKDPKLIEYARENHITFEICPTSNIQTCVCDEIKNHPLREMIDNGLIITINTDNRTVSGITLSDEYEKIQKAFNLEGKDFYILNQNAIEASFLPRKEKDELEKELDYYYREYI